MSVTLGYCRQATTWYTQFANTAEMARGVAPGQVYVDTKASSNVEEGWLFCLCTSTTPQTSVDNQCISGTHHLSIETAWAFCGVAVWQKHTWLAEGQVAADFRCLT